MNGKPLYSLRHGIKVYAEYHKKDYVRCRIIAHRFFPNSKIDKRGMQNVSRARLILSAKLGRALSRNEHAHHKKKHLKKLDTISNVELLTAKEHNRLHKVGTKHSLRTRQKIRQTLERAYASGRRKRPDLCGNKNPFFGKRHSEESKAKMRLFRIGKKHTSETKLKLKAAFTLERRADLANRQRNMSAERRAAISFQQRNMSNATKEKIRNSLALYRARKKRSERHIGI